MKVALIYLLLVIGMPAFSCTSGAPDEQEISITRIYESDDSQSVLYDTETSRGNLLVTDINSIFFILEQTQENSWVIIEKSPARPDAGRVETTHHLFYIPERKIIDIETMHPALSSYGIWFEEHNGTMHLVATLKGSTEDVYLPLSQLLEGELHLAKLLEGDPPENFGQEQQISDDSDGSFDPDVELQFGSAKTDNNAVILELMLRDDKYAAGEALSPQIIVSYTAYDGKIFIVESDQFRILVYDYEGNFLRAINYPPSLPDLERAIIVRDIAADGEFIYLLSTEDNTVYVVDAETEDIAAMIKEGSPRSGQFTALAGITVGHQGYLRIHDEQQNGSGDIYTYRREGHNFTWITTQKYSHQGQMVPSPSGSIYEASVIDDTYEVTSDDGSFMFRNKTPMGIISASVIATDSEDNIYVYCEEVGGQIAGPFTLKVVTRAGREQYSLDTWFWDGGAPITERVVVTNGGEVFDAYYDGDAFRNLEKDELVVTKLIIRRLK
jgi:hypothetical protein